MAADLKALERRALDLMNWPIRQESIRVNRREVVALSPRDDGAWTPLGPLSNLESARSSTKR